MKIGSFKFIKWKDGYKYKAKILKKGSKFFSLQFIFHCEFLSCIYFILNSQIFIFFNLKYMNYTKTKKMLKIYFFLAKQEVQCYFSEIDVKFEICETSLDDYDNDTKLIKSDLLSNTTAGKKVPNSKNMFKINYSRKIDVGTYLLLRMTILDFILITIGKWVFEFILCLIVLKFEFSFIIKLACILIVFKRYFYKTTRD